MGFRRGHHRREMQKDNEDDEPNRLPRCLNWERTVQEVNIWWTEETGSYWGGAAVRSEYFDLRLANLWLGQPQRTLNYQSFEEISKGAA